ncbi:MAG TPA: hypothetical protein VIP98_20140 [Microlunatus sp.]
MADVQKTIQLSVTVSLEGGPSDDVGECLADEVLDHFDEFETPSGATVRIVEIQAK